MSLYSDFQKDKEKQGGNSGTSLYTKFKEEKNYVPTSFKERLTGTPTKQKDGSFRANTGIVPFFKEMGNSLFSGTVGTGNTIGESISVNRGDFDALNKANQEKDTIKLNLVKKINENKKNGVDNTRLIKAYNTLSNTPQDTIQSLAPNSQISDGKAIGNLALMASALLGAGTLSSTAKTAGYVGSQAEKEAIKQLTKQQLKKKFAKDVALNAGVGYMVDVGSKLQEGRTDAGVAIPGLVTAVNTLLPGLIGNQALNKTLKAQSEARIANKYAQEFNIPESGNPYNKIKPKTGVLDNSFTNKSPDTSPIVNIEQGARWNIPEVNPTNQLENRAKQAATKEDFIGNEVGFLNRTKQPITKPVMNSIDKAWEKMHPAPVQEKIPTTPKGSTTPTPNPQVDAQGFRPVGEGEILPNGYTTKMNTQTGKQMTNAPFKETPIKEIPKTKEQTFKEAVDTIEQKANSEANNNPQKVDSINIKVEGEKATKYIETFGEEKARRVALKLDGEPEGVRASAVLAELKNKAKRDGNYVLAKELAISDARKMSSQEINLAKLEEPNSFDLAVKEIHESLRKNQNIIGKMNQKSDINTISQKLRKAIESVNLDNLSIKKLAASLICK